MPADVVFKKLLHPYACNVSCIFHSYQDFTQTVASIMSFGFGVGDFLAGASLAYKLYQTLSETQGSSGEYQSLTAKLLVVHKVLLQVEQLRAANQLAQSTLNAILFLTNGMNEAIGEFMTTIEQYRESLQNGGSGNVVKDIFYKGKWAIKAPEVGLSEMPRRSLQDIL